MRLWDRLYLEVQRYQREDHAFHILDQVIKTPHTFRVIAVLHVNQRTDFCTSEVYVLITNFDLQFLSALAICLWPFSVILARDFALLDDALHLADNRRRYDNLFTNHHVVFVVAVICVSHLTVARHLKLHEFVTKLPFMTHIVPA